jgi:hypothetical protein
MYDTIYELSN